MRLKLLGPLELVAGDRSVDIGGPRQRVVLSMLGLNANRVTSLGELIDAVWDTSPPPTARGQIQTCISGLRKLFTDAGHPEVIKTHPAGYLLQTSGTALDLEEYTSLVTTARDLADSSRISAAAATLRSALGLWRGPALAGVDSRLIRRRAALLEHSKLSTVEERVRLDLALGWHGEIIGELAALVDEHPLREGVCGFLMLALYRSGRQAEALEVYRRAHETLVDELAIEPGQELRDLERAILNRDPALDFRYPEAQREPAEPERRPAASEVERALVEQPMAPHLLPWGIADFTGREDLIAEITDLLTDQHTAGSPGSVPIVAISGPGGVGKSTVAIRIGHELVDRFPGGTLYAQFHDTTGEDRTAMVLSRFLRALGVSGSAVPEDPQERADLYHTKLSGKRLLIVLDGVTDEHQVLPLLPGSQHCTVIVTSRVRLSGLPGATQVDVDVLGTDKSTELLARIVGAERIRAEQAAAEELVRLCGGLPLALRIAGARLASRPHWLIAQLVRRLAVEARRLDELTHRGLELRSTIGLTHRALSPRAQRLFALLSLVQAPDFPGWTAAAVLDTDLTEAQDLVESLVEARMLDVVAHPGERIRYCFHDLIRVYARERLADLNPVERDAALGRVLGGWLALAEEVHRKEYGGDYTILRGAAPRWHPGGDSEEIPLDDPLGWWDAQRGDLVAAVRQAAEAGLDEVCWDLALMSVTLFEVKGYFDHWRATTELGLRVTRAAGNATGHAAMLYSQGTLHMFQKRLDDAESSFSDALARFEAGGNTHGRALVLRNLAVVDGLRGHGQSMLDRYGDALELMRAVGDRMGEAQVLRGIARFWIDEGDSARGHALLADAVAICRQVRCLRGEAQVLNQFVHLHLAEGRAAQAKDAANRVLLIVRDLGDRIGEAYALHSIGLVGWHEGRLDSAETALQHALSLARRVGERFVEGQALHALGEIGAARGDHVTAAAHLGDALAVFEDLASVLWQAKTLILLAKVDLARRNGPRAADELRHAVVLLDGRGSREAVRLLDQVERITEACFALMSAPVGELAADPGQIPSRGTPEDSDG